MDLNLDVLSLAQGLSRHATARQAVLAENIANADTPRYKAKDMQSFAEIAGGIGGVGDPSPPMKATRPGHIGAAGVQRTPRIMESAPLGAEAPNGNTVSLEDQLAKSTDVQHQFNMALGVYRKALDILSLSLARGR